jgi:hypothetical protein
MLMAKIFQYGYISFGMRKDGDYLIFCQAPYDIFELGKGGDHIGRQFQQNKPFIVYQREFIAGDAGRKVSADPYLGARIKPAQPGDGGIYRFFRVFVNAVDMRGGDNPRNAVPVCKPEHPRRFIRRRGTFIQSRKDVTVDVYEFAVHKGRSGATAPGDGKSRRIITVLQAGRPNSF